MRETQPRRIHDFFPVRLLEADGAPPIDGQARTARVCIISEGLGNARDRNLYLPSAIASAAKVFEGKQFYIDHPAKDEDENRPERSVRDLAGYFFDCAAGTVREADTGGTLAACFATLRFAESDPGRLAFEQVKTALEYQKQFPAATGVYAGISINADGTSHPGLRNGMQVNMVTEITEAFSADIVTKPARGGKFLASARESVVGSQAAIAARVAAWSQHQPQRARIIGLPTEGTGMTTTTTVAKEAAERLAKVLTETERPKLLALSEKLHRLGEMKETGTVEASNVAMALLDDIQQDFAAMRGLIAGGGAGDGSTGSAAGSVAPPSVDITKPAEGDALEHAPLTDGMGAGKPAADAGPGDGSTANIGPAGRAGGGQTPMAYTCEACGHENQVLPPEGMEVAPMRTNEATKPGEGAAAPAREVSAAANGTDPLMERLVAKLQRQLQTRGAPYAEAEKLTAREKLLIAENAGLRAQVIGTNLLREANKAVTDAGIPSDIVDVSDLVLAPKDQWPWIIKMGKAALSREAADLNLVGARAGVGHAGGGRREADGVGNAGVAKFQELYSKGGE